MLKRRLMWENASDTHHELVANAMRRDKFEAILTNFQFADNNCLDDADKFSKVRPLVKYLNKEFPENAPVEEFYSFDESMCEYYGRHGRKQFLRGKPISFGFKIWCGTTTLDCLVCLIHIKEKKPHDQWRKVIVSALDEILFIHLRMFFRVTYKRCFIYVLTTFSLA